MKKMLRIVAANVVWGSLAILAAGCNHAETPLAPSAAPAVAGVDLSPAAGTHIVTGTISTVDGQALAGASVELSDNAARWSAVTGADGRYTINDVSGGNKVLSASKDGFAGKSMIENVTADLEVDLQLDVLSPPDEDPHGPQLMSARAIRR